MVNSLQKTPEYETIDKHMQKLQISQKQYSYCVEVLIQSALTHPEHIQASREEKILRNICVLSQNQISNLLSHIYENKKYISELSPIVTNIQTALEQNISRRQ